MDTQHYTISHSKRGSAEFRCSYCDYRVSTKDFDRRNGNVRMQAATAMSTHQASEHKRPVLTWAIRSAGAERVWTPHCRRH
jgi:hypothetical protein